MAAVAGADGLDLALVAHYRQRYGDLDVEELTEMAGKRDLLADEAAAALDQVLTERRISPVQVAAAAAPAPETPAEQQLTLARDLWRDTASVTGQAFTAMAFFVIGGMLLRAVGLGGLLVVALSGAFGYAGYRVGRIVTREICANADKSIAHRRSELRWYVVGVVVAYFLVHMLVQSVAGPTP